MNFFRKVLIPVEAKQFLVDKLPWPDGVWKERERDNKVIFCDMYRLKTSFGSTAISDKDWIVDEQGKHIYVVSPETFAEEFEEATV